MCMSECIACMYFSAPVLMPSSVIHDFHVCMCVYVHVEAEINFVLVNLKHIGDMVLPWQGSH